MGMRRPAAPPVAVEQSTANASTVPLMPGQTTTPVSVQVDFALVRKGAFDRASFRQGCASVRSLSVARPRI